MPQRIAFLISFLILALLTPPAGLAEPPRCDRYGDPLPNGSIFRIGTTRLRSPSKYSPFEHLLFSPDGKFVFSSANGEPDVCLWETATGREVRRFFAGGFRFEPTFALSANGGLLAVSDGRKIHLYDTATGKKNRTLDLPSEISTQEFALAFSADGRSLVLRHGDNQPPNRCGIRLWDIATGKTARSWIMGANVPLALAADTRLVASLRDNDRRISLWETATGKKIREWKAAEKARFKDGCLIFSPDGRRLVAAGVDNLIRVYETATGKEVRSWQGRRPHDNFAREMKLADSALVGGLAFTANGETLASVDSDSNRLYLWDWKTGRELRYFKGVVGPVAFSPDGKIVAAGGEDRRIRLWDTATGRDRCPFPDPEAITFVNFAPSGRILAAGSDKPQVRFLDADNGRLLKRYADYRALTFLADVGNFLAQRGDESYCLVDAGSGKERLPLAGYPFGWLPTKKILLTFDDNSVHVWDAAARKKIKKFEITKDGNMSTVSIFSSDSPPIAAVDRDASVIQLFSLDTGKKLRASMKISLAIKYRAVRGIDDMEGASYLDAVFAPKGQKLLAGIDPATFGLWDVATGKWSLRFRYGVFLPYQPLFSPNGDLLTLLDTRGDPCVVDVATGRVRQRLTRQGGDLFWILQSENRAFSADGRLLAAAYDAQTLVLWELATGRPIRTWSGHGRGELKQMLFSPDSQRLATVCTDGTALVWDVLGLSADGQPSARKLTPAETKQAWTDLGDTDAAKGHRAIWTLVSDPPRALPLLRERLHPAREADPLRIALLIADLDSDDFTVRDTATRQLKKLSEMAQPALQGVLKGKPSLELRRRVQGLLDDIDSAVLSTESLRHLRAVAVLEHMGSEDARKLLGILAAGAPEARLTHEAKASLARRRSRTAHP